MQLLEERDKEAEEEQLKQEDYIYDQQWLNDNNELIKPNFYGVKIDWNKSQFDFVPLGVRWTNAPNPEDQGNFDLKQDWTFILLLTEVEPSGLSFRALGDGLRFCHTAQ